MAGRRKATRLGKNKKKSWRQTDITDVEEHLDDQRLQERTGGLVSLREDKQLFFVDKQTERETIPLKRSKRLQKPLVCHSLLTAKPETEPVKRISKTIKRNQKFRGNSKGVFDLKKIQKAVSVQKGRKRIEKEAATSVSDLWGDEKEASVVNKEVTVVPDLNHHYTVTRQIRVKPRKTFHRKPSQLVAVEVPKSGASYNPTFDDHQDLLLTAHEVEVQRRIKEDKLKHTLDDMFPNKGNAPTGNSHLAEMSVGLLGEESETEQSESEAQDRLSVNPPVRREEKKTQAQRNKDRKKKEKEKALLKDQLNKQRKKELFRIKQIKKQVHHIERKMGQKEQERLKIKELNKFKTKKLGKFKFEDADIEVKLSDELEGSLRRLRPEGSLLEDRFKSFQKRNIIEPRKRTNIVKKYKRKEFEKKSHRNVVV